MKTQELRAMAMADLEAKVGALQEDLFQTRFRHQTAQLADSTAISKTRRILARAKTILNERIAGEAAASSTPAEG